MDERTTESRSTIDLLSDAIVQMASLVRKEVDLAKAEVREGATQAATAAGQILGGVVFVIVALNILSAALVVGLTELGIEVGWAALIVGIVYLVIAIVLVRRGTAGLKAASLAPTRTAESVRRDAQALKETLNGKR